MGMEQSACISTLQWLHAINLIVPDTGASAAFDFYLSLVKLH